MHVHGARAPRTRAAQRGRARARGRRPLLRATPFDLLGRAAEWDSRVAATGRPQIFQASSWAALKSRLWTPRAFTLERGVALVLLRRLRLGITVAYSPRGPLVEDADLPEAIDALRGAVGGLCAAFVCDPEAAESATLLQTLASRGIRRAPVYAQPRRTLLFDLTREPEELLAAMRKKTRQYVRKGEREGVVTEETRDLGRFLAILRRVAERDAFNIYPREYFRLMLDSLGDAAHLFLARVGDDDAAALLVVRSGDRAWELYGGWSGTHPEERPFYLLKWRAMLRMRALGVRRYDMWGLAEGDELAGVENFKLGFGGEQVAWIGALETPATPWLYPLWTLAGRRRLAAAA